jgi:transcriptional regulator with XRE-family HTH domain
MAELLGVQIRMARAALRWSIADLAKRAGVGISSVQVLEAVDTEPAIAPGVEQTREHRMAERAKVVEAIARAFTAAGVTLLPDDGATGPGACVKLHRSRK